MPRILRSLIVLACLGCINSSARATDYASTILYWLPEPAGVDGINATPHITDGMTIGSGHIPGAPDGKNYALVWTAAGAVSNLNPGSLGFVTSIATATDGVSQVGSGTMSTTIGSSTFALLWTGSASSAVNLNPAGYISSVANGVSGNQQVGQGKASNGDTIALLWTGTAASAMSLNPPGDTDCGVNGTDGVNQVGFDGNAPMLWSGTAASAVNLTPTNLPNVFNASALAVGGNEQVGYAQTHGSPEQAIMWSGTGASAVDLNPAGFYFSEALATNGSAQVGWGNTNTGGPNQALLWTGSADSVVNLQVLLPDGGANTNSMAFSIDAAGNVFGIAHGTINNRSGYFAVEWSPVPEPDGFALGLFGGIALLLKRCRRGER